MLYVLFVFIFISLTSVLSPRLSFYWHPLTLTPYYCQRQLLGTKPAIGSDCLPLLLCFFASSSSLLPFCHTSVPLGCCIAFSKARCPPATDCSFCFSAALCRCDAGTSSLLPKGVRRACLLIIFPNGHTFPLSLVPAIAVTIVL